MYYSELVKKAALISYQAHLKDVDKSGYPYFMHPMTLAVQFNDEITVCVALLHDVIEDHGDKYSLSYLEKEGFPKEVIDTLRLLTHQEGVEYLEYIKAIKNNDIARRVKLADLRHNSDLSRCQDFIPYKYDLYQEAIKILENK